MDTSPDVHLQMQFMSAQQQQQQQNLERQQQQHQMMMMNKRNLSQDGGEAMLSAMNECGKPQVARTMTMPPLQQPQHVPQQPVSMAGQWNPQSQSKMVARPSASPQGQVIGSMVTQHQQQIAPSHNAVSQEDLRMMQQIQSTNRQKAGPPLEVSHFWLHFHTLLRTAIFLCNFVGLKLKLS
ncbi:unnamed protein product [Dibothriocephalus latus]|uniref:Uncharacterized protein n=1 Tax=Dibothriocephalus latus TaxID=60516 RepID=A0A3P6RC61_DIBLA|nr:unnamed protein product [Dibothriocephalus latus]